MSASIAGQPVSREQFRQYLGKVGWPVAPNILADLVKRHGAPDDIVATIRQLPSRAYMSDKEVWEEYLEAVKPKE